MLVVGGRSRDGGRGDHAAVEGAHDARECFLARELVDAAENHRRFVLDGLQQVFDTFLQREFGDHAAARIGPGGIVVRECGYGRKRQQAQDCRGEKSFHGRLRHGGFRGR